MFARSLEKRSLLKGGRKRERKRDRRWVRQNPREKETVWNAWPIDSRFVTTAFVGARRERDRSDHCESPGVHVYVCICTYRLPLEISWGLSTCTSRALCEIDSANLLSPEHPSPQRPHSPLLCILRAKIRMDLTLWGTMPHWTNWSSHDFNRVLSLSLEHSIVRDRSRWDSIRQPLRGYRGFHPPNITQRTALVSTIFWRNTAHLYIKNTYHINRKREEKFFNLSPSSYEKNDTCSFARLQLSIISCQ